MTAAEIRQIIISANNILDSTEIYTGDNRLAAYRTISVANHFLRGHPVDIATFNNRCDPPLSPADFQGAKDSIDRIIRRIGTMRIPAAASTGEFQKVSKALDALAELYNTPFPRLFVRGGKLSRVICNEDGFPSIDTLTETALSVIATQCIEWFVSKPVVDKTVIPNVTTVQDFVTTTPKLVIPRLYALGEWPCIPPLAGIVECPYITKTGEIVSDAGYNFGSRLYLVSQNGEYHVSVPDTPSNSDVNAAKELLFDLFTDFQFEDEASRENLIACLITAAIRPTIDGLIPMFVFDKPVMGAGASMLAKIITQITTGRPPTMTDSPKNKSEEEWNKLIIGLLREGRALNIFDNVEGDMYSSALASVLTSEYYGGRLLGKNETVRYPNKSVWLANGNNIQITHDLPRRCVWIRLTTDTARPYERTGWKYPDILEYVRIHQAEYLSAILTIARGWHVVGKPQPAKGMQIMGGFEGWRATVGGIMSYMGCTHFLENTKTNLEIAEEAHEDVEVFLEGVFKGFKKLKSTPNMTEAFRVREIIPCLDSQNYVAESGHVLLDAMPAYIQELNQTHPKKVPQAIGNLFKKFLGRMFPSGYRVERAGVENVALYRISYHQPIKGGGE